MHYRIIVTLNEIFLKMPAVGIKNVVGGKIFQILLMKVK